MKYLALSFGLAFPLLSQATTPDKTAEKDKEIIVLPAFVVNDTKDTGYSAREALSGNKTRQALANLAGAYSVVTNDSKDGLDCAVHWSKGNLDALIGKPVRLLIHLKKGSSYAEPRLFAAYVSRQ